MIGQNPRIFALAAALMWLPFSGAAQEQNSVPGSFQELHLEILDKQVDSPTPICKIDPEACEAENLPPSWTVEPLAQPSIICEIDPLACEEKTIAIEGTATVREVPPPRLRPEFSQPIAMMGLVEKDSDNPLSASSAEYSLKLRDQQLAERNVGAVVCNNSRSRPSAFYREYVREVARSKQCSEAAGEMISVKKEYPNLYNSFVTGDVDKSWLGSNAKLANRALVRTARHYSQKCLSTYADVIDARSFVRMVGGTTELLDRSLGNLLTSDGRKFCSGGLVRRNQPDGADRVFIATALHCLAGSNGSTPLSQESEIQQVTNFDLYQRDLHMIFRTFDGAIYPVSVSQDLYAHQFDEQNDLALIPVSLPEGDEKVGIPLAGSLEVWDPIYLIASHPILYSLSRAEGSDQATSASESLSISMGPYCRAFNFDGRVIKHNCQTEGSMSGALVLVNERGQLKAAGVHTAATTRYRSPVCPADTAGGANQAVLFSSVEALAYSE